MLLSGKRLIIAIFLLLTTQCACYSANNIEDSFSWKPYYPLDDIIWTYNYNSETKYIALTKVKNGAAIIYILFDLSSGSKIFLLEKNNILYLTKEEDHNENEVRNYLPYKPVFVPLLKEGQKWSWESQIFVDKLSGNNGNRCAHTINEKGYTTVLGEETIEVPAGSFKCMKMKTKMQVSFEDSNKNYSAKIDRWYAKNIGLIEEKSITSSGRCVVGGRCELINIRFCKVHESDIKELSKKKVVYSRKNFLESIIKNDMDTVKLFLNAGMNPNVEGDDNMTALHYAADKGFKQIVDLLISNKANVNAKNKFGQTPILLATMKCDKEIIKTLISSDADVNIKGSYYDDTPLLAAVRCNDVGILKLLITSGADVNAVNINDITALHFAIRQGYRETAELLISSGADINAKDAVDYTPLHWAVLEGNKEMVKLLISSGADVNAKNLCDLTPLRLAQQKGFKEIVNLLRKHGAKE